jgi:hypothetical protein
MTPLEQYIRQAAAMRGIDPDIAVRVASGEGGLKNPFRHGELPAPSSQAPGLGTTENSYGPFQLYISGTGAGMGDKALAAGIDPRKDWQGGVNFALDQARAGGWDPWYGAKAAGITGMEGISGGPSPSSPAGGARAAAEIAVPTQAGTAYQPSPLMTALGLSPAEGAAVGNTASGQDQKSPLARFFDDLKDFGKDTPRARSQLPMPSATNGNDLLTFMSNPNPFTDFMIKQRLQGRG